MKFYTHMIREALSLSVHALAYMRVHDWYMLAGGGIREYTHGSGD